MTAIRKITTDKGFSWMIDYYDPQGRRIRKRFPKKAEAYLGKVIPPSGKVGTEDIWETFGKLFAEMQEGPPYGTFNYP